DICKTVAIVDQDELGDYRWLEEWLARLYRERFIRAAGGEKIVAHVRSFIELEKERCRLAPLGRTNDSWPLARVDLLDSLFSKMAQYASWLGRLPVYLF